MILFGNLKTTQKIATTFSLYNFFSLIILLLFINVVYFFIWYSDQKEASMHDMDWNYSLYSDPMDPKSVEEFKTYLLDRDTLIITHTGAMISSLSLQQKTNNNIEMVKTDYFYTSGNTTYFIFSKQYDSIGLVKVLFDTTPYIKSQMIIIQLSLIVIIVSKLLFFFLAKTLTRKAFADIIDLADEVKDLNLESKSLKFAPNLPPNDEIVILANAINTALSKISHQSENLKQFITDVSHEFKTPLMIINSDIDLYNKKLEVGANNQDTTTDLLHSIKTHTKKLNKVLETLFLLSRMEENIVAFDKKKLNFKKYIEKKIAELKHLDSEKHIEITYDIPKTLTYEVEEHTFDILVENLLTNALKFSREDCHITISADDKGFSIADNGVGIPKKDIEKIWSKFFKSDTKMDGFGIGLFLVKRVLKTYGWTIEAQSDVGEGTKFSIYF